MDTTVALWMAGLPRIAWLDSFFACVTFLGDHGLVWIALILIFLLYPPTRRIGCACALALAAAALLVNVGIKPFAARPRPFQALGLTLLIPPPHGYSFPSGHASSSFAVASVVFFCRPGWLRWSALGLAAAITVSRVYFTVHYVSDVAVGGILGILCGLGAMWILKTGPWEKQSV